MSLQISPVHKDKHAKTKINLANAFTHTQDQHALPIVVQEFVRVGAELPIVFVKDTEKDQYEAITMLGLKTGENLMVVDGVWQGFYVPRVLWNHPLVLAEHPTLENQLSIALIESSPMVDTEVGHALFNEDGTETDFLKVRIESLRESLVQNQSTRAFSKALADLDLFTAQTLTITIEGRPRDISGLYIVDEKKLNALSDEKILELHKRGMMPAIYAHLMSLQQAQRLGERASKVNVSAA